MEALIQGKSQTQNKYSLFLIEDDSEIGNWLINKLKSNKRISSLNWAKNYRESENHLKNETPDVIILDLKLPDGNGIDILRAINSNKQNIKVYVFSSNKAFKSACLRNGAADFFDKSTDGEKLIETLEKFN